MDKSDDDTAVAVTGAYKQYDSSTLVLKGLTMTVRKGTIYGLLGASGCGKTTLLSCIIGKINLDAGSIKLCIKERSRLGFMPQELSLFGEFTVEETFFYYGRVYGLPVSFIEKQIAFLTSLLQIPKITRLVSLLSGGQKRRVSFAIALLPSPDILILDEPTVGQDCLLRFSIWEHLLKVAAENTAIIITTHYIEEARQSNTVGFMYDGVLLEEGNPDQLLSRYRYSSLEDVFLHLCHHYTNEKKTHNELIINEESSKPFEKNRHLSYNRLLSQWIKNYLYIRKNVMPVIMFLLVVPVLEVLIMLTCIGNTPYHVPISVVNLEINSSCSTERHTSDCNKTLGCRFIDRLPDKGLFIKHYANHMIPETVGKNSDRYASIIIPEDFTESVNQRFTLGLSIPEAVLNKSSINILIDNSNAIIAKHIHSAIVECFEAAVLSWNRDCGWFMEEDPLNPIKIKLSATIFCFQYNEPVYGKKDASFLDFIAPGLLCLFAYITPLVFSMCALLYEKVTGTMDRSLIAGVLWAEFILAHISIVTIFIGIQIVVMMYIMFHIYGIHYNGSFIIMFFLLIMQGFSGMGSGLLVGVIFSNEAAAINITHGVVFGLSFLAGIIWPKEGMHWIAYYLRYIVPISIPVDSLRSIVVYGESIGSFSVVKGFISSAGWTSFFVLMSIFLMQRKNK